MAPLTHVALAALALLTATATAAPTSDSQTCTPAPECGALKALCCDGAQVAEGILEGGCIVCTSPNTPRASPYP